MQIFAFKIRPKDFANNQNADETPSRIRKWFACTPWQGNRAGALQGGAPTQALLCSITHQQHFTKETVIHQHRQNKRRRNYDMIKR